jgi:hypothetical protein
MMPTAEATVIGALIVFFTMQHGVVFNAVPDQFDPKAASVY